MCLAARSPRSTCLKSRSGLATDLLLAFFYICLFVFYYHCYHLFGGGGVGGCVVQFFQYLIVAGVFPSFAFPRGWCAFHFSFLVFILLPFTPRIFLTMIFVHFSSSNYLFPSPCLAPLVVSVPLFIFPRPLFPPPRTRLNILLPSSGHCPLTFPHTRVATTCR